MAKNKNTKIKGGYFHNGKGKQFTVLQDALANDTKCGCGINCKDGFVSLPSFDSVSGDKEGFHGFYFVDGELVTDTVPNIKEEIKSFCNGPQEPQALRLTFDSIENANTLVGDASNVSDWNAFFDLPTYGTPFTSVEVVGNEVRLFGGSNINLKDSLFGNSGQELSLLEIVDNTGCITSAGYDVFGDDNGQGCENLTTVNLPNCLTIGNYCFSNNKSLTNVNLPELTSMQNFCFLNCHSLVLINLPKLITSEDSCFYNCFLLTTVNLPIATNLGNYYFTNCNSLTTINIPSCTDLGGTVGDDFVFSGINGNTITLTVSPGLMTCNSGSPDGDIQYLQANNTVTVVTV